MGERTGKHLISNEVFNQTLHTNSSSCKFAVKIFYNNDHYSGTAVMLALVDFYMQLTLNTSTIESGGSNHNKTDGYVPLVLP